MMREPVTVGPLTLDQLDDACEVERLCFATPWGRDALEAELGRALGEFVRTMRSMPAAQAAERLRTVHALDERASPRRRPRQFPRALGEFVAEADRLQCWFPTSAYSEFTLPGSWADLADSDASVHLNDIQRPGRDT